MKQPEKSDGLLAKHTLLIRVIETDWATKLDHKVMAVLVERYMSAHRNSRASLRYLEKATKSTRTNVIASLRRLSDERVIWVVREGSGTRPTEFGLNFNFPSGIVGGTSSSGIAGDTSTKMSGIVGDTSRGPAGDTSKGTRGIVGDTESLLLSPLTSRGQVRDKSNPASAHGLVAAPVGVDFDIDMSVVKLTVTKAEVREDNDETFIWIEMQDEDGRDREDSFTMHSNNQRSQDAGQADFQKFLRATGVDMPVDTPEDVAKLLGLKLQAIGIYGTPEYIPADEWGRHAMDIAA